MCPSVRRCAIRIGYGRIGHFQGVNGKPACGKQAICQEKIGGFGCRCKDGYEGDAYKECKRE